MLDCIVLVVHAGLYCVSAWCMLDCIVLGVHARLYCVRGAC